MKTIFLAPLLLLGSCAMFDDSTDADGQPVMEKRVDNAMLQHVPEGERADVSEARRDADVARDAHAAATADKLRWSERRKLADRDLEIAQAELARSQAALEIAENGTQEELDRAKQAVVDSEAVVVAVRSRIALRKRQVEHAEAVEDLRLERSGLAHAKIEATKARAVKDLDRPQAKSIDVAAFELQVRECQEEVELAEVRVEAARKEVVAARTAYDGTVEAVPASFRRDWPAEEDLPKEEKRRD